MSDRIFYSVRGGPPTIFEAHLEHEIDGATLRLRKADTTLFSRAALTPGRQTRLVVSFYVDEHGRVREPNVESDSPPEITPQVVSAVANLDV